jgi:signal transduction histidine kinase
MSPGGQIPAPGGRLTVSVTDDRAAAADLPPRARRADDLSKSDTAELYVEAVRRAVSAELPPWREGLPLVRIAFEDTGPGIPPEVMDRLFEPFFTTKPGGEGTGLGLSTARAVVRAHGGSLTAANLARGASFVVRLPRLEGRSR